ncbi:PhzF family phenazine biosynthesis protein [Pseudomonas syringae]|nr:PhzF family phenazine biosynthesis protein [Pseudomonas syringae]MBD8573840.1 PhzF family phenazine biosynthesis protein [Pseudomonas syringae]MBD8790194.1 PhzF family phenazine biosynthesis protein [Pseudomonas syringae]MBD8803804.1 PhzF family phenazine biosynthesis protein [Pseudomonas syringae]MBD8810134.1 PhzF family phenazine biosynthesis protein [Pseudomonas syringae]
MRRYPFKQLDVFAEQPLQGNPLAVVFDADDLSDERMAALANWTNLSETTFILAPTEPQADYRVRIFTTLRELPFAGHPTLGTCHAWLENGGVPKGEEIVQQCGIGLVRIRRVGDQLAFTAPPLLRSGPVDAERLARIRDALGLGVNEVLEARWVDNGAGWVALHLANRARVLALQPDFSRLGDLVVGVFGAFEPDIDGDEADFEVRAFIGGDGMPEDPVTGSLNAGIARWLFEEGLVPERYRVSQGTALGRRGRVQVERMGDDIWIGGSSVTCIEGQLSL